MDHVPESELAIFAFDPDAMPEPRRSIITRHTAECATCRTTLDFFAVAEDDLSDVDVWEPVMGSATREALMSYAARIADEDSEAEELLKPLFDAPAKAAWTNLHMQKRFLSGGVARRLSAHAHSVCDNEPLDALTFADAAVSVAEALPDDTYPAKAIYELRGTAWKERANAQRLLGECPEALESLLRAERAYKHLASPSLGLSIVALVRGYVLCEQHRLDEAAAMAERAEHGFAHLGDDDRRMAALYLRAGVKFEARNLSDAASLFHQVVDHAESINNSIWMARGADALGKCEVLLGHLGEASMHFHHALTVFREIGSVSEQLSTEWGIAKVLLQSGKRSEAIRRLRDVAAQFETRGMVTDAALVGLDIADALLALGHAHQIVELATRLFRVFTNAGMLTGALTAIAYVKEAAAAGTLTSDDVQAVRSFVRLAERQPALLFVPPPPRNR
jgi:tetratricopeptide (TPR) repeat protein